MTNRFAGTFPTPPSDSISPLGVRRRCAPKKLPKIDPPRTGAGAADHLAPMAEPPSGSPIYSYGLYSYGLYSHVQVISPDGRTAERLARILSMGLLVSAADARSPNIVVVAMRFQGGAPASEVMTNML